MANSSHNTSTLVLWGAGHLADREAHTIPRNQVGESASDIYTRNRCHRVLPLLWPTVVARGPMPVTVSNTPNPNALKFTVGVDVGGPITHAAGSEPDDPMAAELLAIEGVTSMFGTADFITLSKTPDASWDVISAAAADILERYFD